MFLQWSATSLAFVIKRMKPRIGALAHLYVFVNYKSTFPECTQALQGQSRPQQTCEYVLLLYQLSGPLAQHTSQQILLF